MITIQMFYWRRFFTFIGVAVIGFFLQRRINREAVDRLQQSESEQDNEEFDDENSDTKLLQLTFDDDSPYGRGGADVEEQNGSEDEQQQQQQQQQQHDNNSKVRDDIAAALEQMQLAKRRTFLMRQRQEEERNHQQQQQEDEDEDEEEDDDSGEARTKPPFEYEQQEQQTGNEEDSGIEVSRDDAADENERVVGGHGNTHLKQQCHRRRHHFARPEVRPSDVCRNTESPTETLARLKKRREFLQRRVKEQQRVLDEIDGKAGVVGCRDEWQQRWELNEEKRAGESWNHGEGLQPQYGRRHPEDMCTDENYTGAHRENFEKCKHWRKNRQEIEDDDRERLEPPEFQYEQQDKYFDGYDPRDTDESVYPEFDDEHYNNENYELNIAARDDAAAAAADETRRNQLNPPSHVLLQLLAAAARNWRALLLVALLLLFVAPVILAIGDHALGFHAAPVVHAEPMPPPEKHASSKGFWASMWNIFAID